MYMNGIHFEFELLLHGIYEIYDLEILHRVIVCIIICECYVILFSLYSLFECLI